MIVLAVILGMIVGAAATALWHGRKRVEFPGAYKAVRVPEMGVVALSFGTNVIYVMPLSAAAEVAATMAEATVES
jgi:hypothetical protein